jgi:hypothetical protein
MGKLSAESINIFAFPPHQQYLNALDFEITSAKLVSLEALDLEFIPPVVIDIGALDVQIINEKFVHLTEIIYDIEAQQNVSLNEIVFDLRHPTTVYLSAIDIQHKMLSSIDITSLSILQELLPTQKRYWRTLIQTTKLPKRVLGALDIALAFPHNVVLLGVPLVTKWARALLTEVSGAIETDKTAYRNSVSSLYSSAILYYGTNNNLNRCKVKIEAGAGKAHALKTDIFLDFDSWFTRYGGYIETNIKTATTRTHVVSNHMMVQSSGQHTWRTHYIGRRGLIFDDISASTEMRPYIDLGAKRVWVTQQVWLGYTYLNKQVKYGFFLRVPNNVATFPVEQSFLGIPFSGTNLHNLDITINLLRTEEIDFDLYATPNELLNVYGILFGVNGSILADRPFGWIDITELTERHLDLYTGGDMILQVVPSDALIHQDLIQQRPFLFRMFNVDLGSNFQYKLFRKQTI